VEGIVWTGADLRDGHGRYPLVLRKFRGEDGELVTLRMCPKVTRPVSPRHFRVCQRAGMA